ncbi:SAM-dependent methyltransferase [Pseudonocardia xishanensis]|uniref:Methyltransferase type 12 domain-containing protein n=1 Tax=Pseudonocardia xishanensis TaxID=630995 RepID=A0ABP8S2W7_9PSEU
MNATETDARAPQAADSGPGLPARAFDRLLRNNDQFREQLQLTVHRMGLSGTGKRLLVIGCGGGAAVQGVPEEAPGWRVVAVDESHELTRHANEENWPANYWFVTATLSTLEDTLARHGLQGRFDAVLVVFQMRLQRNLDDTLAFLRELLVPGGPLAVHEYSVRGNRQARNRWALTALGYLGRIRSHGRVPGMTEYLWRSVVRFESVADFKDRLRRARFTDLRVQTFGGRQEHVLHTFLARAPTDEPGAGGADDLDLPYTDAPAPGRVRGRVPVPRGGEPRELFTHDPGPSTDALADPDAATPPSGLRAVPPIPDRSPEEPGSPQDGAEDPRPAPGTARVEPARRVAALPEDGPADHEPYDLDDDLDGDLDGDVLDDGPAERAEHVTEPSPRPRPVEPRPRAESAAAPSPSPRPHPRPEPTVESGPSPQPSPDSQPRPEPVSGSEPSPAPSPSSQRRIEPEPRVPVDREPREQEPAEEGPPTPLRDEHPAPAKRGLLGRRKAKPDPEKPWLPRAERERNSDD